MSLLMAYAFERFVFFQATSHERERIRAAQLLYPQLQPKNTAFFESLSDLDNLGESDLLVCCNQTLAYVYRRVAELAHLAVVDLEKFLLRAGTIVDLGGAPVFGEVVLAFLSEPLRKQASRIFSLYGFDPVSVDTPPALQRELRHGASIVILDQDLPCIKARVGEVREKVFALLRSERHLQRRLAVVIVKDFDQGSLFNDMTTLAKDVANAMLSPHEFLGFMRDYLADFHTAHATWRLRMGHTTGLVQATYSDRPSPYLGLKDLKSAFQYSLDKAYLDHASAREQMLVEAQALAARQTVTEWFFDKELEREANSLGRSLVAKTEFPHFFEDATPKAIKVFPKDADEIQNRKSHS